MGAGLDTVSVLSDRDASCMKNAGYTFVMRYYKEQGYPRLRRSEAVAISHAGLRIGVVFETDPTFAAYFTAAKGRADCRSAVFQAMDVGQPEDSAIYFAVDYDASVSQALGPIKAYFNAVNNEMAYMVANFQAPSYSVGVYGDGVVCSIMKSMGLARFTWLAGAMSWPGSGTYSGWNLRQGSAEISVCGVIADYDQSSGVFGAFTV